MNPSTSPRTTQRWNLLRRIILRIALLLIFWVMALITAVVVVPMLGMWLHQQAGVAAGDLSLQGLIALWIVPLAFLASLILIGLFLLMRSMWTWGTGLASGKPLLRRAAAEDTEDTEDSTEDRPSKKSTTSKNTRHKTTTTRSN